MRDLREAGAARLRSTLVRVRDQRQRAARFENVVHGLGDPLTVGPLERLTERHQPERAEIQLGNVLGNRPYPPNVLHVRVVRSERGL
ncbi:MAG: hypothetical protein M3046_11345 [Actinomycetota bacterium]|nr:hypothetical protein [Actinomycetota bacterium]